MESLTYKSKDFYTCCCLLASKFVLKAIEPIGGEKFANFVFDDPKGEAQEVIRRHWAGELKLPTKDFVAAINELKTRLNSVI